MKNRKVTEPMKLVIDLREPVEAFVQRLVDHVATVTQLDPDKDELPNVEDWKRCLKALLINRINRTVETR
jgi:hypothetical protein